MRRGNETLLAAEETQKHPTYFSHSVGVEGVESSGAGSATRVFLVKDVGNRSVVGIDGVYGGNTSVSKEC